MDLGEALVPSAHSLEEGLLRVSLVGETEDTVGLGRQCGSQSWARGQRDGTDLTRFPLLPGVQGTHTYLVRPVVKSMQTQVPLGKCRRWTQAEEGKLPGVRLRRAPDAGAPPCRADAASKSPLNLWVFARGSRQHRASVRTC